MPLVWWSEPGNSGILWRFGGLAGDLGCCCDNEICCGRCVPNGGCANPLPTTLNIDVTSGPDECVCLGANTITDTLTWDAVNNYYEATLDMSTVGTCSSNMVVRFTCTTDGFVITLVSWGPCVGDSCFAACDSNDPLDVSCCISGIGGLGCCDNDLSAIPPDPTPSLCFRVYE